MARAAARLARDTTVLSGRPGAPGVGRGRALLVGPGAPPSAVVPLAIVGPDDEAARLREALATAATQLTELAERVTAHVGESIGAIFVAQALFAQDPGIVEPALAEVAAGHPAAEAIISVTSRQADQLAAVDDEYFRERAADVRDIGRRVAGIVRGERATDLWRADGQPAVLVANDLDPSLIATVRRELVSGIVLEGGSPTGHATIVARALGIPLVLGAADAMLTVPADADISIDGSSGRVYLDPEHPDLAAIGERTAATPQLRVEPTVGVAVAANVASAHEAAAAAEACADGIGLVRTELLFLGRERPPTVAEQRSTYARIIDAAGGRPVVFRTLDVGGDKPASWRGGQPEANPALGVRGVRLGMREPATLDAQLQALVEAARDGELHVMVPMVSTREEVDAVRARLDSIVIVVEAATGIRPGPIRLGVMVEVPAAAVMADSIAEVADFFSIGTNDLVQYTLAADRTNAALTDLASPLQPAVLRLIDGVVKAARLHGRHVSVCGEAAADPLVIPILVGLGVEELSVTPTAIDPVRSILGALTREACVDLAANVLQARSVAEVRELVDGVGLGGSLPV